MTAFVFPEAVLKLVERLETSGYEAWIVGGAVRDSLLGEAIHDVDIATDAHPDAIQRCFSDCRTLDVGKQFGTINVLWDGDQYEITTFRADGAYSDGRHPDEVAYSTDIRDDLMRRDFTINAMAWHPQRGLLDCFGGAADLEAGVIRAVGDPGERIGEDALRMLRAVRFAARLAFEPAQDLAQVLREQASGLAMVSVERTFDELSKMLCARHADRALTLLEGFGLLGGVITEPAAARVARDAETFSFVETLPRALPMRLAGLFRRTLSVEEALSILRRLKTSNALQRTVGTILSVPPIDTAWPMPQVQRTMGRLGADIDEVMRFQLAEAQFFGRASEPIQATCERIDRVRIEGLVTTVKDLAIGGRELQSIGYKQGKLLGELLRRLYDDVVDGLVRNDRRTLIEHAQRCARTQDFKETL